MGLAVIGVFIAGTPGSPPAQLRPATLTANPSGTGTAAKLARTGAAAAGIRLLSEAATAARAVAYQAVQVVSWLAPGSRSGWLSPAAGRVRVDVWHRTGQPPDVVLGLSPTLVGLLGAHYAVVYAGQGSAGGRAATVVEVCRRDGSVAARFWLDDVTKLPLRREIFDDHAHLISMDGLDGLKLDARGTAGAGPASDRAAPTVPAANAASAGKRAASRPQRAVTSHAVNSAFAQTSMAGFAVNPLGPASPAGPVVAGPPGSAGQVRTVPASPPGSAGQVRTVPASPPAGVPAARVPAARVPAARVPAARVPAARVPAARVPAAPARPWADRLGRAQLTALRTSGWPVPGALPGGLTLFCASESGSSSDRVVDLAYSDGLSVISLFLQRGQLPAALPGWRQTALGGHPVYLRNPAEPDLTWSAGGYVYTVVAGAPAAVITSVVDSLPRQGRPGFWARMDRGMRRMLSWINPFH